MRNTALKLAVFLLVVSVVAVAANQFGIADKRQVKLYEPTRIGETLLPPGDYTVVHQMQGDEHIMVFTQAGKNKKAAEARVKCTLVPLSEPAARTELSYKTIAGQEQVLTRMVFKGDRAVHKF